MELAVDGGCVADLASRSVLVHFSSEGGQSWGLGGQPLIPERMPVLIDDDLRFEDRYGPRATRVVNTWLRTLP